MTQSMKICFLAPRIYPYLLADRIVETAGGAELQQSLIGKGLKKKGYEISFISYDYGQNDKEYIDGITVYKSFDINDRKYGALSFVAKIYNLLKTLRKADADIYYVRCATYLPGILFLFCKLNKKRYIYAASHNTNFLPNNLRLNRSHERILYKIGLKHANQIIVQSNEQQKLLFKNFCLYGKVIKNFFPKKPSKSFKIHKKYILWVSTIRSWKRPEHFIRLAEKFSSEKFIMIGGKSTDQEGDLFDKVKERVKGIKNLSFLGFQPFHITESYFDQCKVFVNTSEYEGFPNTFLQAWSRGVPVISYFDPDNVIEKEKLGYVAKSEIQLENHLRFFLTKQMWDSKFIINYFNKNHSSEIIDKYALLFNEILNG